MPRLNVQADVRARLAAALAPIEVRVSVPDPRPATLVVVTREGGHRLNALQDRPGVLAERVGDLMQALAFADGYEDVAEESMRSDPDPDTRSPRWYASYTITTHRP